MDKLLSPVEPLARCMINNHYWASFPSYKDGPREGWSKFVGDEHDRFRVIAVIGAGASCGAGLPLARDAAPELRKALDVKDDDREYCYELERLSTVFKLNPEDFETVLYALSLTDYKARRVRDEVQGIYNRRHAPTFAYEILAHLFKHRFIDAIINFNFDELLDQAISDEMNANEYRYVISDGDCPADEELFHIPLEYPIYVKPHGTASQKSTLRFTRQAYHGLPDDITRVIGCLLRPGGRDPHLHPRASAKDGSPLKNP